MTGKAAFKIGTTLLASAAITLVSNPGSFNRQGIPTALTKPAHAASVQISFFYDRLAPHGTWVAHGRYGYVFVPAVRSGWRPYVNGHWVYTSEYGWYWVSDEPFAWAVYHYGRWAYDPVYGWIWVPGNVWGPAWVTWRYGGGHVGWAPIGPHDAGYVYGTPDYYDPPIVEAWVFVPERRFVAVDVARYVTPIIEINLFLGRSRERHHVRYRNGRAYNPFLPRERVTKIVNKQVNVYNITNVNDPDATSGKARKGQKNTIQTFQAEVSDQQPREKPRKAVEKPEDVKQKPKLEQTATKGKKPADAPPSAAELKPGTAPDKDAASKQDGKPKPEQQAEPKPGTDKQQENKPAQQKKTGKPRPKAQPPAQQGQPAAPPPQGQAPAPQQTKPPAAKAPPKPAQPPKAQIPGPPAGAPKGPKGPPKGNPGNAPGGPPQAPPPAQGAPVPGPQDGPPINAPVQQGGPQQNAPAPQAGPPPGNPGGGGGGPRKQKP